jgi:simple sugar transport system ATP-binding protein
MRAITKRFPGVLANDHISLTLARGEILALLGENGAGKTTLMNVLYGLYSPDEGEIILRGQPVRFKGPSDAIRHGIGMVHQHFMLVPPLSVAENIVLGMEPSAGPLLDRAAAEREVLALARQFDMEIDPHARVQDLSVGVQQRVEILKALYRKADILILDEPTAVLAPQEAEELFHVLRQLAQQGRSVIFITHKLKEVLAVADRIVVLRNGRVVGETTPREATERSLAAMMVGRPVLLEVRKAPARPGETVLEIRDLRVCSDRKTMAVDGASLSVRAGEIVGIAGVQGNGQTELVEALTGLRLVESGTIRLLGRDITHWDTRRTIEAGVSHIPEDRHKHGLVLSYSVADNLVLSSYERPPFSRWIVLALQSIYDFARRLVREFDIRTPSVSVQIGNLSGGNQQKAIVAREFARQVKLLVAAQPTRGLDVGSMEFIHRKVVEARDRGAAVLLVSAELDEIVSLSDRVAVMYRGSIIDILDPRQTTREELGLLMAGGTPSAEVAG